MPIPPEVEPSWKFIWGQVVNMNGQWKMHEQLFGKGPKRMELLAKHASNFFAMVQQTFLLDVQLTLSKLGDPSQSGKFDNMTLAKLADEIREAAPNPSDEAIAFHQEMAACLSDFADKSKQVRERRNKYLAHLDYDVALDQLPIPLETPTRREIEEALQSVTAFMWTIEKYFGEATTVYNHVNTIHDGDDVVRALKGAARYFELVRAGKIDWTDLTNSPWANA
jgi:hypothetical protein